MRKLGQNPSEAELIEMISTVDDNGDNEIDFPEFLILMKSRIGGKDPEKELRDAFRVFDTDNSGSIDRKELKRLMKKLGQALSDAELDAMMDEVDTNGDGQISFEEFKDLMVGLSWRCLYSRWRLDLDLRMMMSQTSFALPILRNEQNT
jgi:calmodulin